MTGVSRRLFLTVAAFALAGSQIQVPAMAQDAYKFAEPGVLSVAITGDMPGLVSHGPELAGYDGEILQIAADNLGIKIRPVPME